MSKHMAGLRPRRRPEIGEGRLYGDLAWLWPIMSPPDDYVHESEEAAGIIRKFSEIETRTLLNLGCGGGHNDRTLKRYFAVTGVDLSAQMLSLAGRLNPEVEYIRGDMRNVRLGRRFDAVTLFDSVSYMLSRRDLEAAFRTALDHLKPGGVFLTYAEQTSETFRIGRTRSFKGAAGGVEVAFIENQQDSDPRDTVSETVFVYIIQSNGRIAVETDRHRFGLFGFQTWLDALRAVGFRSTVVNGRITNVWGAPIPWLVSLKPA